MAVRAAIWNYIVRHWRGSLSLSVSFWINWVMLTVVILTIINYGVKLIPDERMANGTDGQIRWVSYAVPVAFSIYPGVVVWQLVGIVRGMVAAFKAGNWLGGIATLFGLFVTCGLPIFMSLTIAGQLYEELSRILFR